MRRLFTCCCLATLLASSRSAVAEDPPPYRGFRADLQASDAAIRVRVTGWIDDFDDGATKIHTVSATIERVFKGKDLKRGDTILMIHDSAAWDLRLEGELDCPGGVYGNGVHFFGHVPAAGGSFIALARHADGKWKLDACCLAEPTGGLSFTSAEQAKAYGDQRNRAVDFADAAMDRCVRAAAGTDAEAASEYTLAMCALCTAEGAGDADLAIGVLLDDFRRVAAALKQDKAVAEAVAAAHAFILADGAETNAQAANLRSWLVGVLTLEQRREAAGYYAKEYRKTRREADEDQRRVREPKDPKDPKDPRRPESFEASEARRLGIQTRLKELPKLIALAINPAKPPDDLSSDELLEKADEFAKN